MLSSARPSTARSRRTATSSQASARALQPRWVFINCPFDDDYRPLLRAACFTIMACGYVPRCALDISDSGMARLEAIVQTIARSGLSIHDISRVQLDDSTGLPRFNMPLELGADLGLRLQGGSEQRRRRTLVLDSSPHQYDISLSDLSGMDVEVHGNDPSQVVRRVRDWLSAHHRPKSKPLPGGQMLAPDIITALRLDPHDELPHSDFLRVVKVALERIESVRDLV